MRPVRLFVTGTDTGVGKTQVSCALLSLLADAGLKPGAFKPYESGCQDLRRPADALALKTAAGSTDPLSQVCPHRFRAPLAPGIAAAREGRSPDFGATLAAYRGFGLRSLVVEGAGGLFVPVDDRRDVIDLIARWKLPVVLVARAGLGTLNHTALSLGALAGRGLQVCAVVLSSSTRAWDPSVKDNAEWLRRRHRVPVVGPVPFVAHENERKETFRRALRPLISELLALQR